VKLGIDYLMNRSANLRDTVDDSVQDCCQVRVYSGRGSGQVRTKADEGREQRAGQEVSPAGVGDRLD